MALIKCPECGQQISDKAPACIHCGCPVNQTETEAFDVIFKEFQNIDARRFNSSAVSSFIIQELGVNNYETSNIMNNPPRAIMSGLNAKNANWIKDELIEFDCILEITKSQKGIDTTNNEKIELLSSGVVLCPRCGSSSITTGQRGFNIVSGFWGSNKTVNRCGKCGYSWEPKK